jgi:BatD DUF11 like domain
MMMKLLQLKNLSRFLVGWGINPNKTSNRNPMLGFAPQPTPEHSVATDNKPPPNLPLRKGEGHYSLLLLLRSVINPLPLRRGGLGWGLFCFLFFIVSTPTFADSLTTSVDRDTLGISETLTLTLRHDPQINATPDYSLLEKDFEILNTQSGRSMSIVNGRTESYTQWKLTLAPRKTGKLLIPSFDINGNISDAIEITVEKQSSQFKSSGNEPVSVEVSIDKETVFTQEQIIFTVRLITNVSLTGAQLDPLSIPDTFVTELDEQNYKTTINNQPALIVEKRYAIFPLKSGSLTIPALRYQVAIDDGDIWSRMSGSNNILRLMTEEKTLTVKAPPSDKTNWLPAEDLRISEHWSAGLDNLKVGEPISRTITITAQGLTAAQIPPVPSSSIEGLTLYQDQAQTDNQKNKNGNQGSRIETTAIVPNKDGKFTLPETRIEWWNTKTQQYEVASLPAVSLSVGTNSHSPTADEIVEAAKQIMDKTSNPDSEPEMPTSTDQIQVQQVTPIWIYVLLVITSLLSLFFFLAWWNLRQRFNTYVHRKNEMEQIAAESEARAWNQVKEYLQQNNLIELRKAIVEWSKLYWKNDSIQSLQDVTIYADSIPLQEAFAQLDASLFGNTQDSLDKQKLKELLTNLRRGKTKKSSATNELRPLYND